MATIETRGPCQYRVKIRKKGHKSITHTFLHLKKARRWARKIESEIEDGLYFHSTEAENTILHVALERYAREVTSEKKSAYAELARIKIRHPPNLLFVKDHEKIHPCLACI